MMRPKEAPASPARQPRFLAPVLVPFTMTALCAASLWLAFSHPLSLPCPQVGVALTSRGDAEAERRVRTGGPAECCQARSMLSKMLARRTSVASIRSHCFATQRARQRRQPRHVRHRVCRADARRASGKSCALAPHDRLTFSLEKQVSTGRVQALQVYREALEQQLLGEPPGEQQRG